MNPRDIKKQKYEESKAKNRIKRYYGKYPKKLLSNDLLRYFDYSFSDVEVLKDKLACNVDSWHDYKDAGICKRAIELRKSFYFDIEKCRTIADVHNILFELADAILNGVDNE